MNINEIKNKISKLNKNELLELKGFITKEIDKKNEFKKFKDYNICLVCGEKINNIEQ